MAEDVAIRVEHVSKKYCKSLKRTMIYGMKDIGKNMLGMSSQSDKLRKAEFWAVDDVSFEVKKGETLGIIGPNGSGKTTLLKLLNGVFWPDKGKITITGKVGALIEVGSGFHPVLTGRENIFVNAAILGMNKKEVDKKFNKIIDFAEIGDFIDVPVKFYSMGMLLRLGFSVAVYCEIDVLLIDEVLAVGDLKFQSKCLNRIGTLKKNGTTIVMVSHSMHTISSFAEKTLLMNRNKFEYFENSQDGIMEYRKNLFSKEDYYIQKICCGNDKINFSDIRISKRKLIPGESFCLSMQYKSIKNYNQVEIESAISASNESELYFKAGNQAYNKSINLPKGKHKLKVTIKNIQINNSTAELILIIWSKNKTELLFWWEIPVKFERIDYCTGKNFLKVLYEIK